tara:strand:+ start:573 stop:1073 length:501 start_codon:yes stop_codon:yes gene_type:complete
MKRKLNYFIILFVSFLMLNNCGFQSVYKLSNNDDSLKNYLIEYTDKDNVAREIKEVFTNAFISNDNIDYDYRIQVAVSESENPLIINVNGTVAKYRIDITINYNVIGNNNDLLYSDTVRGFSQYNVGTSEIDNRQKKREMVRAATYDAVQIMISKIQSTVVSSDDN